MDLGVTVEGMDISRRLTLGDTRPATLADAFIGTKQTRYTCRPSPDNLTILQSRLHACHTANRPIDVLVIWGGSKGYNQFPLRTADLLDYMALTRLSILNHNVKSFHTPGIRVKIFWEDYTTKQLRGAINHEYRETFLSLADAMGMSYVDVITESSVIPCEDFKESAKYFGQMIYEGRESEVGWQGEIAWSYYMDRAASELPHATEHERRQKVSIYLGLVLAKYRYGVTPKHDIKFSFVPYPCEVPDWMRRGRVECKVKPGKDNNKTVAPWACFGVLRDDDWTTASVRDLRSKSYSYVDVVVNDIPIVALTEK